MCPLWYNLQLMYIMPYKIRKVRNQSCYKVYNATTRKVYAKCATRENAEKQVRFLNAFKYSRRFRKTVRVRK